MQDVLFKHQEELLYCVSIGALLQVAKRSGGVSFLEINKLSSLKVQISGYSYVIHLISTKGEHMPELPRIHRTVLKLRISIRAAIPIFSLNHTVICMHMHTHTRNNLETVNIQIRYFIKEYLHCLAKTSVYMQASKKDRDYSKRQIYTS